MTINDINVNLLNSIHLCTTKNENEWQVKTGAKFENGKSIEIYLIKEGKKWYLTDRKSTLKYMNSVYDLKSNDVKSCIMSVIKIYGFYISGGELCCELENENEVQKQVFDFIMCISQLANMYAFFDKP